MQHLFMQCDFTHLLPCTMICRLQQSCCILRYVCSRAFIHLLPSPNLRFRHHFDQIPQLQETCLYPRLNEALRNHDMRSLEPFLPFMKLLLSGLYRLPLVHGRTYRGVKLELFKVVAQTNRLHLFTPRYTPSIYTPSYLRTMQSCDFMRAIVNVTA